MYQYVLQFILIFITLPISAQTKDWVPFNCPDGTFVEFPGLPKKYDNKDISKGNAFELYVYDNEDFKGDNFSYVFGKTTYSQTFVSSKNKQQVQKFFYNAQNNLVNKLKAKLVSTKRITYKDYPGMEFMLYKENQNMTIIVRQYIVESIVYLLEVLTVKGKEDNANLKRFFNSLIIVGGKT